MISPSSVMANAEKMNAAPPVSTESDSRVSSTLVVTLPQIMVASTWLAFLRRSSPLTASALPPSASIWSRNRLRLKTARLRPANSADWAMQAMMPNQTQELAIEDMDGTRVGFQDVESYSALRRANDGSRRPRPQVGSVTRTLF